MYVSMILSVARVVAITLVMLLVIQPVRAAELLIFESDICYYCELWHEEVGVGYPHSSEGKCAPLRRVDIYEDRPEDLENLKGVYFTPTFVIVENGQEVTRWAGYMGAHMFWPELSERLAKLNEKCPNQGGG